MLLDGAQIALSVTGIAMKKPFISNISFEEARRLISILIGINSRPYSNIPLNDIELELVALLEKYCKNYYDFTSEDYERLIYLIKFIFGSEGGDSGYKETVRSFTSGYEEIVEIDISDDEEVRIKKKEKIMEALDFNERLRDRLTEWIFGILEMFRAKEIVIARELKERLEAKRKNKRFDIYNGIGITD